MTSAPPAPQRPRSRRLAALGLAPAIALVLAGGIVTAVARQGDDDGPRAAVDRYYGALERADAASAFAELCAPQRQSGEPPYAALVARNESSGSGVRSWSSRSDGRVDGDEAQVDGVLSLDESPDNSIPITIFLLHEAGGWKVCNSNLGGILPGPGSKVAGTTT